MPHTSGSLKSAHKKFTKREGRVNFYCVACEAVEDYPLQAAIVILATWNKARFHYLSSEKETLGQLENAIKTCLPIFKKLKKETLQTANLDENDGLGSDIKKIYAELSKVPGVKYTGSSKVMSIFNPALFVMWDTNIRRHYGIKKSQPTANDYLGFLKEMQEEFGGVLWRSKQTPLAKVIDEYNYVKFTLSQRKK